MLPWRSALQSPFHNYSKPSFLIVKSSHNQAIDLPQFSSNPSQWVNRKLRPAMECNIFRLKFQTIESRYRKFSQEVLRTALWAGIRSPSTIKVRSDVFSSNGRLTILAERSRRIPFPRRPRKVYSSTEQWLSFWNQRIVGGGRQDSRRMSRTDITFRLDGKQ